MYKVVSEEEFREIQKLSIIKSGSHWYYKESTALQYFRKKENYYILRVDESNLHYAFIFMLGTSYFGNEKGIEYNKEIPINVIEVIGKGVK